MEERKLHWNNYNHFNKRIMERYGISIDYQEYLILLKLVKDGNYNHIRKSEKNHNHIATIEIEGFTVYIVLSPDLMLRTALTKRQALGTKVDNLTKKLDKKKKQLRKKYTRKLEKSMRAGLADAFDLGEAFDQARKKVLSQ